MDGDTAPMPPDASAVRALGAAPAIWAPGEPPWAFLRRGFTVPGDAEVRVARLYLAASSPEPGRQFVARVSLNGTEVGLGPVRSVADEHRYEIFPVTEALRPGPNAIGVLAWTPEDQRVQIVLEITVAEGRDMLVTTSPEWKAWPGDRALPALGSIGTGYFTAPREHLVSSQYPWGFDTPGFDDAAWPHAQVKEPLADLRPNPAPSVHAEEYPAASARWIDGDAGDGTPAGAHATRTCTLALDFGGSYVGGLSLGPIGRSADLTIRFGEMRDAGGRVRQHMATGNHYEDRWELSGTESRVHTWGWRTFRYVEIDGLPEDFDPAQVRALGHVYPLGERTRFRTDDGGLREVLDLCEHTLVQANGPLLVDSWNREREPYEADAYLQAKANAALSADRALADYGLDYLLVRRTWPTEWPFYLVLLGWEQYLRSGDAEALAGRRNTLAALLPTRWIDPTTGLVRKLKGSDGSDSRIDHDIVDWPPSERDGYRFGVVNTVVNAIALGAYRAMARIDAALGRDEASEHQAIADRLAAAMNTHLWDEQQGTFIDGLDADGLPLPHAAAHAGAFASAFGATDPERSRRVADFLAPRGMAVSVYAAPFLLRALLRGGRLDDAYALLVAAGDRSWLGMIDAGAGATMEAWNEQAKPNVSCAHPWGASPLFLVVEDLLGIRPLAPGHRVFEVAPQIPRALGTLGASVPTTSGTITVDVSRAASNSRCVRVDVPAGTSCLLRLGDATVELGPGRHERDLPACRDEPRR